MNGANEINVTTLCSWLVNKQPVSILDIRLTVERAEWYIAGSVHYPAYEKLKKNDPSAFDQLYLDKNIPVVAYCSGGNTSIKAAEQLQQKGYKALSLEGGLNAWSFAWNKAEIEFERFKLIQFRRTGKGCLSYMIISGKEAMVLDASIEIAAYQEVLGLEKLYLKYVAETHIHADHLSRSKELAAATNAQLFLPQPNKVAFEHKPIESNSIFQLGHIKIKAFQTPGHTIESTSFMVDEKVVLTGDTLFLNGIGRPDLKATTEELHLKSKLLYNSLQELFLLNKNLLVFPSHTNQPVDFDEQPLYATLADCEQQFVKLNLTEEQFAEKLNKSLPPTPPNYLLITEKNLTGDYTDIEPRKLEAGANRCALKL